MKNKHDFDEIWLKLVEIEHLQNEIIRDLKNVKTVLELVVRSDMASNKALVMLIDKIEKNIEHKYSKKDHVFDDIMIG